MIILMMEGLNRPSGQFRPHQARCAASAMFPALCVCFVFFCLQEGHTDFVLVAIVICVSDRGKERCRDNKVSLLTKMH